MTTDIFRDHPERRRECLYYLALGNYRLGNYAEARRYNEALLDNEPQNLQSQSLRTLIDDKVAKGGLPKHSHFLSSYVCVADKRTGI